MSSQRTLFYAGHPLGWLHRRDIRYKGAALVLLQTALWSSNAVALAPLTAVIWVLYLSCGLRVVASLRALRPLLLLGAITVAINIAQHIPPYLALFGTPRPPSPELRLALRSLASVSLYVARFLLCALLANLFICTTTSGAIMEGLEWLLRPLSRARSLKIALTCTLALTLVGRCLTSLSHIKAAMWCRHFLPRTSPLRAIKLYATALLRALTVQVNTLASSIYLRRYGHRRSPPRFHTHTTDWVLLIASALVSALGVATRLYF